MNDALQTLGELLMRRVRDEAIEEWDKIIDGKLRSDRALKVQSKLNQMSPDQIDTVRILVPQIVDSCLHHLLWTLEQANEVEVNVRLPEGSAQEIREMSDGLPGELYGSNGWIAKFSRQRHVPPV